MTARAELLGGRAETAETTCSTCKSLVLRLCGVEAARGLPTCSDCGRVVCAACELGGRCAMCFAGRCQALAAPDER